MPVPVTAVMSGTTTAGNSLWVTACGNRSLPWDTSLLLDTTSSLVVVITAATGRKTTAVIIGKGAVTVAVAVTVEIATVGMTAHTPPPLLLLSLSDRMSYFFLV